MARLFARLLAAGVEIHEFQPHHVASQDEVVDEIVAFFERPGGPLGIVTDCLAMGGASLDRVWVP